MQCEAKPKSMKLLVLVACALILPFVAILVMAMLSGFLTEEIIELVVQLDMPLLLGVLFIMKLPISKTWRIAILLPYSAVMIFLMSFYGFWFVRPLFGYWP